MGYYTFLFFIPVVVWIFVAKIFIKHKFSYAEMSIQASSALLVFFIIFSAGYKSQTHDVKFVNGVVTDLNPKQQNCPWGWRDFTDSFCTEYRTRTVPDGQTCSTNSNGNRTCRTNYKTQYNYIYEWERRYFVNTDIDKTYEIKRIDPQGVNYPPRFSEINVGDPVTAQVNFVNYIKGASDSLLNQKFQEVAEISYPNVRDYYKANKVIYTNYPVSNDSWSDWNQDIQQLNSDIQKTGANVIVVVTGHSQVWADQLAQGWDAHNINDIVVTIGMQQDQISWVDVKSWSKNEITNIEIRDNILDLVQLDKQKINAIIKKAVIDNYEMRPMSDFEYLADDIPPPMWAIILAVFWLLVVTPLTTFIFHKYDVI